MSTYHINISLIHNNYSRLTFANTIYNVPPCHVPGYYNGKYNIKSVRLIRTVSCQCQFVPSTARTGNKKKHNVDELLALVKLCILRIRTHINLYANSCLFSRIHVRRCMTTATEHAGFTLSLSQIELVAYQANSIKCAYLSSSFRNVKNANPSHVPV